MKYVPEFKQKTERVFTLSEVVSRPTQLVEISDLNSSTYYLRDEKGEILIGPISILKRLGNIINFLEDEKRD